MRVTFTKSAKIWILGDFLHTFHAYRTNSIQKCEFLKERAVDVKVYFETKREKSEFVGNFMKLSTLLEPNVFWLCCKLLLNCVPKSRSVKGIKTYFLGPTVTILAHLSNFCEAFPIFRLRSLPKAKQTISNFCLPVLETCEFF